VDAVGLPYRERMDGTCGAERGCGQHKAAPAYKADRGCASSLRAAAINEGGPAVGFDVGSPACGADGGSGARLARRSSEAAGERSAERGGANLCAAAARRVPQLHRGTRRDLMPPRALLLTRSHPTTDFRPAHAERLRGACRPLFDGTRPAARSALHSSGANIMHGSPPMNRRCE